MAYTYDDFISAANGAGLLNSFNKYDLETAKKNPEFGLSVLSLKKDAASAGTPEAQLLADASINNLRKTYGNYTIGDDGSYLFAGSTDGELQQLLDQSKNYGSFTYDGQSELDRLQAAVTNPEPFTYDAETDPLFGSYKKTYLREGERAAQNALAAAAAANGGQISTSALAAGQQAQNYYNAQLADIIPSLRQNAYNERLQELALQENALQVLLNERANEQSKWQTGFDILQQNIANLQAKGQEEYQEYLNRETLANNAIANALTLYQTLGRATPEVAAVLGIPEGTMYGTTAGGSGSGSGTVGAGVVDTVSPVIENYSGNGAASMADVAQLQKYLNSQGAGLVEDGKYGQLSAAAVKNLTGQDLTAEEAVDLWKQGLLTRAEFDVTNMIAMAPNGMNEDQVRQALGGVEPYASEMLNWIDEKLLSGDIEKYERDGKIKFKLKV